MFDLNTDIDVKVDKKLLLDRNPEERYFSFYLGINPTRGHYYKNPLRPDSGAGCKFYRNSNKELVFRDFARNVNYSFIDVVIEKFGCNYGEAIDIIANDFNIRKIDRQKNKELIHYDNSIIEESSEDTIIECTIKEFSKEELDYWLKFGITLEILNKFHVYSIKHVFINGKLIKSSGSTYPIFGYYFGIKDSIHQWKIYCPFGQKGRKFLCNTRCLQGLANLPKNGEFVVVTKSYKDVMSLYAFGIPAIAPQGEGIIINESEYKYLKSRFKYVIFNADWDRTGQAFMIKSLKKYDGIAFSFSDKIQYAKDFSDFICKFGIEKGNLLITYLRSLIENGFFEEKIKRNRRKFQRHN